MDMCDICVCDWPVSLSVINIKGQPCVACVHMWDMCPRVWHVSYLRARPFCCWLRTDVWDCFSPLDTHPRDSCWVVWEFCAWVFTQWRYHFAPDWVFKNWLFKCVQMRRGGVRLKKWEFWISHNVLCGLRDFTSRVWSFRISYLPNPNIAVIAAPSLPRRSSPA